MLSGHHVGGRHKAVHLLWAASVLGGLAQSLAGAAGALLAQEVGGSDDVAGLPQALLVAGAAVSALALSGVTRRHGRSAALTSGASVAVIGCLLVSIAALSASFLWILVGSLLLGAGTTAVMLGRYAAADLGPEVARARSMASVLVATTIGAVAGPNLLAPAGSMAVAVGLPELVGPYLIAAATFAAACCLAMGLGTRRPSPISMTGPDRGTVTSPVGTALGWQGWAGLAVLSVANLVMVSVMTMAPVHLHHVGAGLGAIGLVVSLHIAGMFAPSPPSGWLTDRAGAAAVSLGAGAMLIAACALAAVGAQSSVILGVAMVLLGIGWNLGLVAGSVLLTAGVPALDRPRQESWGEVGMGAAAAGGGAASGLVVATGAYPVLATIGAVAAGLILPFAWHRRTRRSDIATD